MPQNQMVRPVNLGMYRNWMLSVGDIASIGLEEECQTNKPLLIQSGAEIKDNRYFNNYKSHEI